MHQESLMLPVMLSLGWFGIGLDTTTRMMPRAGLDTFFEVRSVTAERVGGTAILHVDREIHYPIHMAFTVRVMEQRGLGWQEVCAAPSNVILYLPDAELPDPVTLDWWTWGKCPNLPDGPVRIVTTWEPEPRGMEPLTVVTEIE